MNTRQTCSLQWPMKTEAATIQQTTHNTKIRLTGVADNATLESEILLAHTLNKSRTYLRTYPQQLINAQTITQLDTLVERRINGEPIAYITGQREFWSLNLIINKNTLIPRPETETLVELALDKIAPRVSHHIADLGTGSGAIALALASERPNCHFIATDVSEQALHVAEKNAANHALKNIEFRCGNWFEPIANELFDLIVSNPPYIENNDPHLQQGDLRFEPESALQSGKDGLNAIRLLVEQSKKHLLNKGWLIIEHGYQQRDAIIALLNQYNYSNISCYNDIQNLPRVILGQIVLGHK